MYLYIKSLERFSIPFDLISWDATLIISSPLRIIIVYQLVLDSLLDFIDVRIFLEIADDDRRQLATAWTFMVHFFSPLDLSNAKVGIKWKRGEGRRTKTTCLSFHEVRWALVLTDFFGLGMLDLYRTGPWRFLTYKPFEITAVSENHLSLFCK